MAVPVQTPFVEYIANGVTTNFSLGFDCENQSHLIVTVDDIEPIVGSWSLSVGAVVFNSAPISGSKIIIKRNSPFERDRDFQLYDQSFRPPAVNIDLDRIWRKLQELGVMDWLLSNRIDDLKNYVDDRDDELRAYLLEEIRKQGVALDQLEDYYNYFMQRLAQIAVDKGWDASFVVDESGKTQQEINNLVAINVESVAEMLSIVGPREGQIVNTKSYYEGLGKGGAKYIFDPGKVNENNDFTILNGWVLDTDRYSVEQAGAKGDNFTDDAPVVQNALKVMYPPVLNRIQDFGSDLYFDSPRYKFNSAVLVPPYSSLKGCRAILLGDSKKNDCFHSARYINGVLTDNTSETDLDNPIFYSRLQGFRYRDFNKSMHLKGWTQQCIIDDVETTASNQHLVTYGCYFLTVGASSADGVGLDLDVKKPAYVFEKSYGMLKFKGTIQASSCPIAYEFSQEQQASTLSNLDAESCEVAIRFRNPIDVNNHGGFLITGCYFENCQTILEFIDMGRAVNVILTYTLKNNFINCHDGALARLNDSQNVKVIFNEEDNKVFQLENLVVAGSGTTILLSDTTKNANYNYTAGIAPNSPLDVTFVDKNTYGGNGVLYGHWGQNFQRIVQWDSDSGRVQAKHNDYMRGMIPYTYYGNQGTPQDGTIPFCSHETQTIDASLIRLRIVTAIASNEMVQASFNLKLRSQATLGYMSGRFYNNKVAIDRNDFIGATFRVSVESGVYVLIIENISSTDASNYSVYGHVKLI